jgi:hypothetical protein
VDRAPKVTHVQPDRQAKPRITVNLDRVRRKRLTTVASSKWPRPPACGEGSWGRSSLRSLADAARVVNWRSLSNRRRRCRPHRRRLGRHHQGQSVFPIRARPASAARYRPGLAASSRRPRTPCSSRPPRHASSSRVGPLCMPASSTVEPLLSPWPTPELAVCVGAGSDPRVLFA